MNNTKKKQPVKKQPVKKQPVKKQPVKKQPVKKQPVKKQPVKKQPVPVETQSSMEKQFVVFLSPGTFFHESSEKPIDSWDVEKAKQMAHDIVERHNATPFGFYFITRSRGPKDLDSKMSKESHMYYLGGKVETLAEVKARATKEDSILIGNMECNGYDRIITNTNSWKVTQAFNKDDVVLDWDAPKTTSPKN